MESKSSVISTITSPEEFAHLLASVDEYNGSPATCYALRIMPYVIVRSSELRGARWQEIDFKKAECGNGGVLRRATGGPILGRHHFRVFTQMPTTRFCRT